MKTGLWVVFALGVIAYFSMMGLPEFMDKRSPGQRIYENRCARCHGEDGRGNTPKYLSNHLMNLVDDEWKAIYPEDDSSMILMIKEGIVGKKPSNQDLDPDELKALVSYLKELRQGFD